MVAAAGLLAAMGPAGRDGAVIANSGSTNFPGFTVQVWSDGKASGGAGSFSPELAKRFFEHAAASKSAQAAPTRGCMKSASFGSTTTVLYHGWTSPDLECPQSGPAAELAQDVREIVTALGMRTNRRIPLMPEPRRFPMQASPSPEPGDPTS